MIRETPLPPPHEHVFQVCSCGSVIARCACLRVFHRLAPIVVEDGCIPCQVRVEQAKRRELLVTDEPEFVALEST